MSNTYKYLNNDQLKVYLEVLWIGNVDYASYRRIKDRIVMDHTKHSELRSEYLESISSTEGQTAEPEARKIEAYEALAEKI